MRIDKTYILGFLLLAMSYLFHACVEDDTCGENVVCGLIVSVQNSGDDASTDLDALNHKAVTAWKICPVGDTLAFVSDATDYQYGIPLSLEDTAIALVFYIKDDKEEYQSDTLHFYYHQTDMKLISVACGFAPEFQLTGGQHGVLVLDSIVIEEPVVNTDLSLTNVAIYY